MNFFTPSCRICLQLKTTNRNLFEAREDGRQPNNVKLSLITGINVPEEMDDIPEYPKFLCKDCEKLLDMAFDLRIKARKSDEILSNWYKKIGNRASNLVPIHNDPTLREPEQTLAASTPTPIANATHSVINPLKHQVKQIATHSVINPLKNPVKQIVTCTTLKPPSSVISNSATLSAVNTLKRQAPPIVTCTTLKPSQFWTLTKISETPPIIKPPIPAGKIVAKTLPMPKILNGIRYQTTTTSTKADDNEDSDDSIFEIVSIGSEENCDIKDEFDEEDLAQHNALQIERVESLSVTEIPELETHTSFTNEQVASLNKEKEKFDLMTIKSEWDEEETEEIETCDKNKHDNPSISEDPLTIDKDIYIFGSYSSNIKNDEIEKQIKNEKDVSEYGQEMSSYKTEVDLDAIKKEENINGMEIGGASQVIFSKNVHSVGNFIIKTEVEESGIDNNCSSEVDPKRIKLEDADNMEIDLVTGVLYIKKENEVPHENLQT